MTRGMSRGAILATVGTVVGLLVGLATLFDFFGGLFGGSPPPETISTRIESAKLEPTRQPLGDFLQEQGIPATGLSPEEKREEGLIFLVSVHLQGSLGKTVRLRCRIYNTRGHPLPGREYDQILGEYTPAGQDHDRRAPFWLPYPPRSGRYYARFTLVEDGGRTIDDSTTPAFRIGHVPSGS